MLVEKKDLDYYYTEPVELDHNKKRKVKKQKNNKKVLYKLVIIGLAIISLFFTLFILVRYADITKKTNEVTQLENQKIELQNDKEILIAQLEGIKSSTKIAEDAKLKLGMSYPTEDQIIYIGVEDEISNEEIVVADELSLIGQLKNIVSMVFGLF